MGVTNILVVSHSRYTPDDFSFNGLTLGLLIDVSIEPCRCLWEYRNAHSKTDVFRGELIQVTVQSGAVTGISAHFFRALDSNISFYSSSCNTISRLLGEPLKKSHFSDAPECFRRAFAPPAQVQSFRQQLLHWSYGDGVEDAYEGFQFRDINFGQSRWAQLGFPLISKADPQNSQAERANWGFDRRSTRSSSGGFRPGGPGRSGGTSSGTDGAPGKTGGEVPLPPG